jgi:hypothetical protein
MESNGKGVDIDGKPLPFEVRECGCGCVCVHMPAHVCAALLVEI